MRKAPRTLITAILAFCLQAPAHAEPAAVAKGGDHRARTSFEGFAKQWMAKMHRAEKDNRAKPVVEGGAASYRGYGKNYRTELKATGHATAPYVGILRYQEHLYQCADAQLQACKVANRSAVTEIFRFQNGRWVY